MAKGSAKLTSFFNNNDDQQAQDQPLTFQEKVARLMKKWVKL